MKCGVAALAALALASAACSQPVSEETLVSPRLFLGSDQAAINDALLEKELLFQDGVATCMSSEGFEYFPRDDTAMTKAANAAFDELYGGEADALAYGLPSESYASEWGYGIARRFLAAQEFGSFQAPIDRNEEYLDSLSSGELTEYASSLGNCEVAADQEFFTEIITYRGIAEEVGDEVELRLANDSRILSLDRDWSECVRVEAASYDLFPEKPIDLLIAMELESDEIPESDTESWKEFLRVEQDIASVSSACASKFDYASTIVEIVDALTSEELAQRGYD